ncbi:outer membrane beta-barrel protein [Spirosoma fluminis]
MKKILLTAVFLCIVSWVASAQTETGRWMVGVSVGSLTYQDQPSTGYKTFSVSLSPSAGYFVMDNLLVGTGLPLSVSTSKTDNPGLLLKTTTTGIGLAPFVRYYFGESKLKPYIGVSYSYTANHYTYKTRLDKASGSGHTSLLVPGIGLAYFINRNIALNAGLNYTIQTTQTPYIQLAPAPTIINSSSDFKLITLGVGFQLFLGN